MASLSERYSDNAPGKYYVDTDCIACDTCAGLAPENFALTNDHHHAIVTSQPKNAEQERRCEEAMAACPVASIGNNGE